MHPGAFFKAVRTVWSGADGQRPEVPTSFLDSTAAADAGAAVAPSPPPPVDVHLVLNALALLRNRSAPTDRAVAALIDAISGHLGEGFYLQRRRYRSTLAHLEQWCADTFVLAAESRKHRCTVRYRFTGLDNVQPYELGEAVGVLSRLFRALDAQVEHGSADVAISMTLDVLRIDVTPLLDSAMTQKIASTGAGSVTVERQGDQWSVLITLTRAGSR